MNNTIPRSLRIWILIQFALDIFLGIWLLLEPRDVLRLFSLSTEGEILVPRLVGAALIGIGVSSFLVRNGSRDAHLALFRLKLWFTGSAVVACLLSSLPRSQTCPSGSTCTGMVMTYPAPIGIWYIGLGFGLLFCLWLYCYLKLRKQK